MLTREQKLLFSRLIFNAKEILFADSANSEVTKPEKASKWFEILMQLNSVGANIPDYKTIRDQEWSNMRRAVEKKLASVKANEGKSQEEQVPIRPFTQTEEIVLDILGKGSGTTQKTEVDLSDFPVQGTVRVMESMTSGNFGGVKFEEDDDDEDDAAFIGGEDASETNNTSVGNSNVVNGNGADYPSGGPVPPGVKQKKRGRKKRIFPTFNMGGTGPVEMNELRRKKLRLECMKLELEIEKLPLECAKLELEIQQLQRNLSHS